MGASVWRDFRLPMPALATITEKNFPIAYSTIADADIRSLKSLHTLFDKYLDHMLVEFELNRMVQTIQNFEPFSTKH